MPLMLPRRREDMKDLDEERGVSEKNPWKEIEGTVRKVDEDRVKDCTEDVDALLVFAGLYSAVLTAFLIESYKNLAADETNTLLQQMVLQTANYRFTNGYLNSTFDPSLLPTFKAAVSDIRVNVCWFASLILSLSSASFGIAVKQWLREFLAIDYISPEERLRIRDARIQGLADWKLFQIAAFLPILLQISLLLFFVGLCFFTAAVHRSIGITSLFLVSCWAFLFFMSIIAPLFSPRCPYKTTLLKVPFRYARPHLRVFLAFVYGRLTTFLARLRRKTSTNPGDEAPVTSTESAQESPRGFNYLDDYLDLGVLNKLYTLHVVEEITVPEEEDKIRSADGQDPTIFSNIDVAFFDDSLLTKMPRALSQRPPPLRDTLRSVITIVQGRIGPSLSKTPAESTREREPWPWTLSQRARVALVDMLAESMVHDLHHIDRDLQDWARLESLESDWAASFVFLILLMSPYDAAPNSVARLFKTLSEYKLWWAPFNVFAYQMRTFARSDPDWPARSLLFLAQSLDTLNAKKLENYHRHVAHRGFVDRDGWAEADTYRRLLERTTDEGNDGAIAPTPLTILALLEVARVVLQKYISEQTQDLDEFPERISHLLQFVLDATPGVEDLPGVDFGAPLTRASDGPGLCKVLTDLFTTPQTTGQLLRFFATRAELLSPSHSSDQLFFPNLIRGADYLSWDDDIKILGACAVFFVSQSISTSQASFTLGSPANLLRICSVVWGYDTSDNEEVVAAWETLFTAVYACYEHITQLNYDTSAVTCQYSDSYKQHTETCETAYTILEGCEVNPYNASNEMVKFLRNFLCASHHTRWGHKLNLIERLETAEAAAAEAAASKQPPGNFTEKLDTGVNVGEPAPAGASPADVGPEGPGEDGASRGPVGVGDALLGVTVSLPPHSFARDDIISGSGIHDTGERALESSRPSTFVPTTDKELQERLGVGTIDDAPGSRPLGIREDSPFILPAIANVSASLEGIDPRSLPLDAPTATTDTGRAVVAAEHTSSTAAPRSPDSVPLPDDDDDAPGGNVPRRRSEDVEAASPPVSRAVSSSSCKDRADALSDVVGEEGSVGYVAELGEEGSGQLVALKTSELAPPVTPDVHSSSDDDLGTGGGVEFATGTSRKVVEEG